MFLSDIAKLLSKVIVQFTSLAAEYENFHCSTVATILGIVKHALILANLLSIKLYHCKLRIFVFFLYICSFFIFKKNKPMLFICYTNTFSLSVVCLFTLFKVFFVIQKYSISIQSNGLVFPYGLDLRNPCPLQNH